MGPLDGIKIVELAMWVYVPSAASVLREWGAEVIKIEHPEGGDPIRNMSIGAVQPGDKGITFMWEIFNRGKRSVGIDLHVTEGRELLYSLVEEADVFLTSLLPESRRKMQIDIGDLMPCNPGLIYGIGSGQGYAGPEAEKGGFDQITFWSRGGIAAALTKDGEYPPMMPAGAYGDCTSGLVLAGGVAAALARKARTGKGGVVDGSLFATAMWSMQASIAGSAVTGLKAMPTFGREDLANPLVNVYRTSDGRHVVLAMIQADRYWREFCHAMDLRELAVDPRFLNGARRAENCEACVTVLDDMFSKLSLSEVTEMLSRQEGPWDVVRLASELRTDEQALANGYLTSVEYPEVSLPMVGAPVQFDRRTPVLSNAPELAANTEQVLLEHGLDWEAITDLKMRGAIA